MFPRFSFTFSWKKLWKVPSVVDTYFLRKILKNTSSYCTREKVNLLKIPIVNADDKDAIKSIMDKFENYEGEYKGGVSPFWKCVESDVAAYYFMMCPEKEKPILIEFNNIKCTDKNSTKAVLVDFNTFYKTYEESFNQAVMDFAGVVLVAGTAYYVYKIWKREDGLFLQIVYMIGGIGAYVVIPALRRAILFPIAVISGPELCVETFRGATIPDGHLAGQMMVLPLFYFVSRQFLFHKKGRPAFFFCALSALSINMVNVLRTKNKTLLGSRIE